MNDDPAWLDLVAENIRLHAVIAAERETSRVICARMNDLEKRVSELAERGGRRRTVKDRDWVVKRFAELKAEGRDDAKAKRKIVEELKERGEKITTRQLENILKTAPPKPVRIVRRFRYEVEVPD